MPNGFGFNPLFLGGTACPTCGYAPAFPPGMGMMGTPWMGPWYGGPMTWGGTFPGMYAGRRWMYEESAPGDEQIKEMIYDAIDADPVIPFESDINVDVTAGTVTLTGTVPNKRIKHALGDDAWWVPGVWDVNNTVKVAGRRERGAPAAPSRPTTPTISRAKRGK